MSRHLITLSFALLLIPALITAQPKSPLLDKRISLSANNERLAVVLARISKEGGFSFSYSSSVIQEDQLVTITVANKPIRDILNDIFKGTIDFKEKKNHIILTKVARQTQQVTTAIVVSGYVEDAVTRERLPDASVYDKRSVTSVVTDQSGFFRMKLDKKEQTATIAVSKRDYKDTLVVITAPGNQYLNISIAPIGKDSLLVKAETTVADSTHHEEDLSMPYADEPNVVNISDTMYSDIQISLVPFVGSNGSLSGNMINNYSINMLAGYSRGTRQIELGFLVNMDREDVSWLQIAGFGNLVGGNVYGVQASGFANIDGGETKAVQLTGLANVNFREFRGVQVAGLSNTNLESADGVTIAGLANMANGPSKGVQIAGGANLHFSDFTGSQIAGISNISSDHVSGSQISALFNFGRRVRGTQIGLINCADTLGGVPIGVVSYVRGGYHKLEVSADEVFYTNLAFRTGVRTFYNIVMAGIKPEKTVNDVNVWTFGYGVGTAARLSRTLQLNVDLTAQHVNKGSFTHELSLLNKVHVGVDFQLARKFSAYGGFTVNGYLTNTSYTDYPELFTNYKPSIFYDHTYNNGTNLKMWFGAQVGLRFF
ncbi:MAG TPA: carboxypeptidase-like regulatory domain-containing protein [Cyclobacteriaceae bacterium]|nr:carboxypeptidase-like regulatory domain-containing protein [Cyclobacteriaceae bacterium]